MGCRWVDKPEGMIDDYESEANKTISLNHIMLKTSRQVTLNCLYNENSKVVVMEYDGCMKHFVEWVDFVFKWHT